MGKKQQSVDRFLKGNNSWCASEAPKPSTMVSPWALEELTNMETRKKWFERWCSMILHGFPWFSMATDLGFLLALIVFPQGPLTRSAVGSGRCCTCNMQRRRSCWMCTKEPGSSAGAILSWKHVVCQHTISRHFFSVTSKSLFYFKPVSSPWHAWLP